MKLLILGALVVGAAMGSTLASGNSAVAGCDLLGGLTASETATSAEESSESDQAAQGDADQTSPDSATGVDDNPSLDTGDDSGSGDTGSTGDGSQSDGGQGDGSTGDTGGQDQPDDETPADDGPAAIAGAYAGTLSCRVTQSVGGGSPGTPRTRTVSESITFDDAGVPAAITVINFAGAPNQTLSPVVVGQQQTYSLTHASKSITLTATVRAATFASSTAHIELDITYGGLSGQLTEQGTATQTIDATLDAAGALTFTSRTRYDVNLRAAEISLDTVERTTCTGTLPRQ